MFLAGIKENNVLLTNPFVVDAMLPLDAKTTTTIMDHMLFCDHAISLEFVKILENNSEFHLRSKKVF